MATSSSGSYRPAGWAAAGRGVFKTGSIFNLGGLGAGLSSYGV